MNHRVPQNRREVLQPPFVASAHHPCSESSPNTVDPKTSRKPSRRFEVDNSIEDEKQSKEKFVMLVERIKEVIGNESLKRKEIEERLQVEGFEYSLSTFKNCLKWMLRKEMLSQQKRGEYSLVNNTQPQDTDIEEVK